MCPMHSETKQTKMLVFGAEKGLLQGHARKQVVYVPPNLELPERFNKTFFFSNIANILAHSFVVGSPGTVGSTDSLLEYHKA